jgi:two-component system alkaline phosphatase synthesis response regulator PhoP
MNDLTKHILIVDDDIDLLSQMSAAMDAEGYQVVRAGSQQEGEEALLTGRPDLAILDLMMEQPDSGFILCHRLKELYPETPVILLTAVTHVTGLSFATTDQEAKSWMGVDLLLDKPIRPDRLSLEVKKLLHRQGTKPQ